jgi:signal transduction histidine kinase
MKKNYPVAIEYMKKYQALKDSVNKQDNIAMITEMEAVYKAEKAERENALLTKDIEKEKTQRDYLIIIAVLVVVLSLITYSRYHSKKIANTKLRELNTVKDKFFGIIAHDLKNPFNVILGYTEILLDEYDKLNDEEKLELVNQIDKSSKQTYRLLENLLIWSRAQIGGIEYNPKKFDLSDIVNQIFMLFDSVARNKKIQLETNNKDKFEVFGDEEMIRTVIRNLVFNGIKFTNNGGKVSVLTEKTNRHIKVTVEDNGIGISKDRITQLFSLNNISTTEGTASEKGTGLGLVLCKELVNKNGGEISVFSDEGKGSRFIFTIPSK